MLDSGYMRDPFLGFVTWQPIGQSGWLSGPSHIAWMGDRSIVSKLKSFGVVSYLWGGDRTVNQGSTVSVHILKYCIILKF